MDKRHTNTSPFSPTEKRKKKSLLFGAMKSMHNSINRNIDGFANSVGNAFMSSNSNNSSFQEQRKKQIRPHGTDGMRRICFFLCS